jgi:hypothetical protein
VVENLAAHVVEKDVDSIGAMPGQRIADIFIFVVDSGVEAGLPDEPVALLGPAGEPDHAASFDSCDHSRHRASRTGCARHHERLARLHLSDVQRAEVRRQARDAEQRQREQRICARRELLHPEQARAVTDAVVLPTQQALHQVALGKAGPFRFDDLSDRARFHHLSQRNRRDVGVH